MSVFLILLAFVLLLILIYGDREKLALLYVAVAILCLAACKYLNFIYSIYINSCCKNMEFRTSIYGFRKSIIK
jgi:hypothetical protein